MKAKDGVSRCGMSCHFFQLPKPLRTRGQQLGVGTAAHILARHVGPLPARHRLRPVLGFALHPANCKAERTAPRDHIFQGAHRDAHREHHLSLQHREQGHQCFTGKFDEQDFSEMAELQTGL